MSDQPTTLFPCPFCGGRGYTASSRTRDTRQDGQRESFAIHCQSCAAQGPWAWTERGARAGWERRPELRFDAQGLPVLTELEQADALRTCIAEDRGGSEDAIGHLLDLLARFYRPEVVQAYAASNEYPFRVVDAGQ